MFYKIFNHVTSISFNQYAQLSFVTTTRHPCHSNLTPTYSKKITFKVFVYGKNNSNLDSLTTPVNYIILIIVNIVLH